jgi:sodium pump decarboxylase gamma subunit
MSPLLEAGLNVTAIGLGVVFVLLTALVFIIRGMSALALAIAGPVDAPQQAAAGSGAPTETEDREIVGVISAAVTMHRQRHRE